MFELNVFIKAKKAKNKTKNKIIYPIQKLTKSFQHNQL